MFTTGSVHLLIDYEIQIKIKRQNNKPTHLPISEKNVVTFTKIMV